jgi:DNA-binding transcriptional MerR regulator
VFNLAKNTTDPKQLKAIDVQLRQIKRAMEAEVKGSAALLEDVFKNKKIQERNFNTQVERTRVAGNRVTRAQKKLEAAVSKTDTKLSKELEKARKSLDGAIVTAMLPKLSQRGTANV